MPSSRVSVVIPTLNRFNMLREAVESCIQQTQKPMEIIISDNGSSDETLSFDWPDLVRVIKEPNLGAGAARKAGLAIARGDLVLFLDSDDLLNPSALELLTQVATEPKVDLVHGLIANFFEVSKDRVRKFEKPISAATASGVLLRRTVFDRFGAFEDGNYSFLKWVIKARDAGLEIRALEETICLRRIHDSNLGRETASRDFYLELVRERIKSAKR